MTPKLKNIRSLAAGFGLGLILLTALAATTVQTITLSNIKDLPSATPSAGDKILGITNNATARLFTISALPISRDQVTNALAFLPQNGTSALTNLSNGTGSGLTNVQPSSLALSNITTSPLLGRGALGLPENSTNSVIPVAGGGTGASTADLAKLGLGIRAGTLTTSADGTTTNNFVGQFSGAPFVIVTQIGNSVKATNLVSAVTVSNFVFSAGAPSISANWVALGSP